MELMLVYRALRKISDWTLSTFYSEVYVDGQENVPPNGPVILCSNHHNEIIDIATLAVTIPHRRQVCFWAKSGMFKNPISRFIMVSSGSIPVNRNPNSTASSAKPNDASSGSNGSSAANGSSTKSSGNASLFASTSRTIASGRVVGVFPEGTSYTEPRIMQVKEGAAWAALEYVRWARENGQSARADENLALVPVGIVYTDQSQYLSRIRVQYGEPIPVAHYASEYFEACSSMSEGVTTRAIVAKLTADIERAIYQLTVNAPDWDTLRVAQMSRDILWNDTIGRMPLKDWLGISQTLVDLFSPKQPKTIPASLEHTRASLLRYAGLLHYTNIHHGDLSAVAPTISASRSQPSRLHAFRSFLYQLAVAILHPRFAFFLPVFILHTPGYFTGYVASRVFASPKFVETIAQFKVIFGGVGFGLSYTAILFMAAKAIRSCRSVDSGSIRWEIAASAIEALARTAKLMDGAEGLGGRVKGSLVAAGLSYGAVKILAKWHSMLVEGNYVQFRRLVTSFKIFFGLLCPPSSSLRPSELGRYTRPPRPPPNPFVKYPNPTTDVAANGRTHPNGIGSASGNGAANGSGSTNGDGIGNVITNGHAPSHVTEVAASRVPDVPFHKLIRHLLAARTDAESSLARYLEGVKLEPRIPGELSRREWEKVFRRGEELFNEIGR